MLTFFRRIRRGLLASGATTKYLLYAIGEIALVVIGILIALQINNWNQKQSELERAISYHQRLIEDLDLIIERNEDTNESAKQVMTSISKTVEILDSGKIDSDEEKELINYALVRFSRLSRQISDLSTWEEMKSNGDMNLIYNIALRKKVNELQDFIDLAHEVFGKHASAVRNDLSNYSKYIRTNVDSTSLTETVVADFDAMIADKQFINEFSYNLTSWRNQASFSKNIIERAAALKEQILHELESMSQ